MRFTRIMLPLLAALALAAGCSEQKAAPEGQQQAQQGQQAPQQTIEAAKPAPVGAPVPEAEPVAKAEPEAKPVAEPKSGPETPPTVEPEPEAKVEPAPVNPARVEPRREITRKIQPLPETDRPITLDRAIPKDADTEPTANADGPAEKYVLPELEKVELPTFEYPDTADKMVTIVFTGNVIGELEPCG